MNKKKKKQGRPQCPEGECTYWSQEEDGKHNTFGCTYTGYRDTSDTSDETGGCLDRSSY